MDTENVTWETGDEKSEVVVAPFVQTVQGSKNKESEGKDETGDRRVVSIYMTCENEEVGEDVREENVYGQPIVLSKVENFVTPTVCRFLGGSPRDVRLGTTRSAIKKWIGSPI